MINEENGCKRCMKIAKKCNRLPKTNCIPFPKSISIESDMEPEKGSMEAVIIFAIVFGGIFGAALVFGAFI